MLHTMIDLQYTEKSSAIALSKPCMLNVQVHNNIIVDLDIDSQSLLPKTHFWTFWRFSGWIIDQSSSNLLKKAFAK